MTIAAGFVYEEGVLLCADTQHAAAWVMKLHGSKIAHFVSPSGVLAFAYAGNSAFAISAIQRCKKNLENTSGIDLRDEVESILHAEYHRNVLNHPGAATDGSLHYNILVAIRQNGERAKLYETHQTSMTEVDGYQCIGAGEVLAHYLIRPLFEHNMTEDHILLLSAYSLGATKRHIESCGGITQFVSVGNDGTAKRFASSNRKDRQTFIDWIEEYSGSFDEKAHDLLFSIANPDADESLFRQELEEFNKTVITTREHFLKTIQKRPALTSFSWTPNP